MAVLVCVIFCDICQNICNNYITCDTCQRIDNMFVYLNSGRVGGNIDLTLPTDPHIRMESVCVWGGEVS